MTSATALAVQAAIKAQVDRILWNAFLAGFEASSEGFNGEYAPNDPTARLREKFEAWKKTAPNE